MCVKQHSEYKNVLVIENRPVLIDARPITRIPCPTSTDGISGISEIVRKRALSDIFVKGVGASNVHLFCMEIGEADFN